MVKFPFEFARMTADLIRYCDQTCLSFAKIFYKRLFIRITVNTLNLPFQDTHTRKLILTKECETPMQDTICVYSRLRSDSLCVSD